MVQSLHNCCYAATKDRLITRYDEMLTQTTDSCTTLTGLYRETPLMSENDENRALLFFQQVAAKCRIFIFFHVNQLKQMQILIEVTGPGAFSKT